MDNPNTPMKMALAGTFGWYRSILDSRGHNSSVQLASEPKEIRPPGSGVWLMFAIFTASWN